MRPQSYGDSRFMTIASLLDAHFCGHDIVCCGNELGSNE